MSETIHVTKEYLDLMKERLEYFNTKTILELTDEEIQEFINLKKEFNDIFEGVNEAAYEAFQYIYEVVNEVLEFVKDTPEFKAQIKYQERVLNRSESNE